ncbi:MAG TPA: TolC family protein, partial [Candidatus Cloacimonadota bacterium]|nr:TolC family protein [Candidatus Cloacimonadota bacterium]
MKKILMILISLMLAGLAWSISLEESLEMAKAGNKELLKAKEDIFKADATYNDVKGNLLPQLSLQGGYTLSKTYLPDSAIPASFDISAGLDSLADGNDHYLANTMNYVVSSMIPSNPVKEGSLAMQLKFQQVLF